MRTITRPDQPWGVSPESEGRYKPTRPQGKRVAGWEDVNITQLAHDVDVSFRYLLAVLSGQRNCTLALLQHVAYALGVDLATLVTRIERAHHLQKPSPASNDKKAYLNERYSDPPKRGPRLSPA